METENLDLVIAYSDIWRCGNVQYFSSWWVTGGGIDQAFNFLVFSKGYLPLLFASYE